MFYEHAQIALQSLLPPTEQYIQSETFSTSRRHTSRAATKALEV